MHRLIVKKRKKKEEEKNTHIHIKTGTPKVRERNNHKRGISAKIRQKATRQFYEIIRK